MQSNEELLFQLSQAKDMMDKALGGRCPQIGIILGSGLNFFADLIANPLIIPFEKVPYMQTSTANGHVGQFVYGKIHGTEVLCMQGRLHGYEGYSACEVAFPVWLMHEIGVKVLITTNAAGAINESFQVGDFCMMGDMINFTGRNPLCGTDQDEMATRFVSMLHAFDPELRALARKVADQVDFAPYLLEGVYLGLLGPSFETPAEIRMFRGWGADTVAMSVCEEVIAARHVGMRVFGLSLISNMACGINDSDPDDIEIQYVAEEREDDLARFLMAFIPAIS